jgi:choline dehydrogenase
LVQYSVGYARLITNPAANWLYSSEPEENTSGRRIPVPRGKLLGGSSSINGQVFVRGQAHDFDTWAQLGNRGWSYADVLPFFRRMESYAGAARTGFAAGINSAMIVIRSAKVASC